MASTSQLQGATPSVNLYSSYIERMDDVVNLNLNILRWWSANAYSRHLYSTSMFLASDENGCRLQGFCSTAIAPNVGFNIEENRTYKICMVQIRPINKHVPFVDAPVELHATRWTIFAEPISVLRQPPLRPHITTLNELPDIVSEHTTYKDILAIVVHMNPPIAGKERHKVTTADYAQAYITDATIYPAFALLSLSEETIASYPIFSLQVKHPFLIEATTLRPTIIQGVYGFETDRFARITFIQEHTPATIEMLQRIIALKNKQNANAKEAQRSAELFFEEPKNTFLVANFIGVATEPPPTKMRINCSVRARITHISSNAQKIERLPPICSEDMKGSNEECHTCTNHPYINSEHITSYRHKLQLVLDDGTDAVDVVASNKPAEQLLRMSAKALHALSATRGGQTTIRRLFQIISTRTYCFTFDVQFPQRNHIKNLGIAVNQFNWIPPIFDTPEVLLANTLLQPPMTYLGPSQEALAYRIP